MILMRRLLAYIQHRCILSSAKLVHMYGQPGSCGSNRFVICNTMPGGHYTIGAQSVPLLPSFHWDISSWNGDKKGSGVALAVISCCPDFPDCTNKSFHLLCILAQTIRSCCATGHINSIWLHSSKCLGQIGLLETASKHPAISGESGWNLNLGPVVCFTTTRTQPVNKQPACLPARQSKRIAMLYCQVLALRHTANSTNV